MGEHHGTPWLSTPKTWPGTRHHGPCPAGRAGNNTQARHGDAGAGPGAWDTPEVLEAQGTGGPISGRGTSPNIQGIWGGKELSPSRCDAPGLGDLQPEAFQGRRWDNPWDKGSGAKDGERRLQSWSQEPPLPHPCRGWEGRCPDGKERAGMEPGRGIPPPRVGMQGGDEPRQEPRCAFAGASHRDQQPLARLVQSLRPRAPSRPPTALYFLRQPLAASPIMSQYSPNSSLASSGSPMHSIFSSSGPTHCGGRGKKALG